MYNSSMENTEEWRPVVGREGEYEVSSLGRVRSLARVKEFGGCRYRGAYRRRVNAFVLKPWVGKKNGYEYVSLGSGNKGIVHRIVATAFIGPAP
jgi:hypothetical protein